MLYKRVTNRGVGEISVVCDCLDVQSGEEKMIQGYGVERCD